MADIDLRMGSCLQEVYLILPYTSLDNLPPYICQPCRQSRRTQTLEHISPVKTRCRVQEKKESPESGVIGTVGTFSCHEFPVTLRCLPSRSQMVDCRLPRHSSSRGWRIIAAGCPLWMGVPVLRGCHWSESIWTGSNGPRLGRKSSKRIQTGEPICLISTSYIQQIRTCTEHGTKLGDVGESKGHSKPPDRRAWLAASVAL